MWNNRRAQISSRLSLIHIFSKAVRLLADEGFDMEYMYAFISRDKGKAFVIIRMNNGQKAAEVLKERGFDILSPETLYNM